LLLPEGIVTRQIRLTIELCAGPEASRLDAAVVVVVVVVVVVSSPAGQQRDCLLVRNKRSQYCAGKERFIGYVCVLERT
jgi:hypothetical protein